MMKVFYPSNGKKIEVNLDSISRGKFFWSNLDNPNIFELNKISKKIKVSMNDLTKYKGNKYSRLICRKDYDILLLKFPIYDKSKVSLKNIEIVFNKKFILTIYDGKLSTLNNFIKNLKYELVGIKKVDYLYFLNRILAILNKKFLIVLDKIEFKLERVEDDVLKPKTDIKNLFFVKKSLLYTRKALVSNRNLISDLQEGASKYLVPEKMSYVYNEIEQIMSTEELFRERLTSSLDLHLSSISNKMNDVMKSFTIIASLLLIPMLISSIYGMNIKLPIQQHPNAFYTLMLFVMLSIIFTLLFFRRKNWI